VLFERPAILLLLAYWGALFLADTASFVAAPLTGEAIPAGILLPASQTFRHIDHTAVIRQFFKAHFTYLVHHYIVYQQHIVYQQRLSIFSCLNKGKQLFSFTH
jgi:hypothetical protein